MSVRGGVGHGLVRWLAWSPVEQSPDPLGRPDGAGNRGVAGSGHDGPARARTGRGLVVGVAGVEAVAAAGGAVAAVLSGVQDGALVLAAAVAGVAGAVAYLLGEVARGFARGRRWPTGVFVTAQLLVALVALSLGGRGLLTFADNLVIALVTVVSLLLAAGGLVGVWLLASGRTEADPVPGEDDPPPVF